MHFGWLVAQIFREATSLVFNEVTLQLMFDSPAQIYNMNESGISLDPCAAMQGEGRKRFAAHIMSLRVWSLPERRE